MGRGSHGSSRTLNTVLPSAPGTAPTLMMRPEQVRKLRALGMDVGAHTVTHPILARLEADAARAEIGRSKAALEGIARVASGYSNLEYDVARGERGHRADHVDELLALLFPGFAAHVVNNNAAAAAE